MSDNLRRYRAIRNALTQAYPTSPTGNFARHLQTLAALISGIVGSKSTQLPTLATKVPDGTKPESRVKRFARWIDNARILEEMYFLPYAEILLTHLALETLVLVMDGSVVGRGCAALMIHVIYKGRALPLAWRVRQGPKGQRPWQVAEEVRQQVRSERGKTEGIIGTLKSNKYGFNKPKERLWQTLEMAGLRSIVSFNLNKLMRDLVQSRT